MQRIASSSSTLHRSAGLHSSKITTEVEKENEVVEFEEKDAQERE